MLRSGSVLSLPDNDCGHNSSGEPRVIRIANCAVFPKFHEPSHVVGYYPGDDLTYVARVRNGFIPASRRQTFATLKPLLIPDCPFANLPETHKGRWGEGLTVADMEECVWVRPEIVARIEFLEWTDSGHLRHSKFAGIREDKDARSVVKEHGGEG